MLGGLVQSIVDRWSSRQAKSLASNRQHLPVAVTLRTGIGEVRFRNPPSWLATLTGPLGAGWNGPLGLLAHRPWRLLCPRSGRRGYEAHSCVACGNTRTRCAMTDNCARAEDYFKVFSTSRSPGTFLGRESSHWEMLGVECHHRRANGGELNTCP